MGKDEDFVWNIIHEIKFKEYYAEHTMPIILVIEYNAYNIFIEYNARPKIVK